MPELAFMVGDASLIGMDHIDLNVVAGVYDRWCALNTRASQYEFFWTFSNVRHLPPRYCIYWSFWPACQQPPFAGIPCRHASSTLSSLMRVELVPGFRWAMQISESIRNEHLLTFWRTILVMASSLPTNSKSDVFSPMAFAGYVASNDLS